MTWSKDKQREYHAAYYQANKKKILTRVSNYAKTPEGKCIAAWSSACWGARKRGELIPERPSRMPPGGCEACDNPPLMSRSLHMDHNHETGEFRGWLCSNCNRALGFLGDDIERLYSLAQYMSRQKPK
mgnify:FL=1